MEIFSENVGQTAALITAAGLSSRMKDFKPLLPLGNSTVIRRCIGTFTAAGCHPIVVVTGKNADLLEEHLRDLPVLCVRNPGYASGQMLDSVKLGLRKLAGQCSRFFFTPCDVPLVKQSTLQALLSSGHPNCRPVRGSLHGHPALISASLIPDILRYDGPDGLKGALKAHGALADIGIDDPGAYMDADTPADYEKLLSYAAGLSAVENACPKDPSACSGPDAASAGRPLPGEAECLSLLAEYGTPPETVSHCRAAASLAEEICGSLAGRGAVLNRDLARAGALLHDIAKTHPGHAARGAEWLAEKGYPQELCSIVRDHLELPPEDESRFCEKAVVYLADKLVLGTRRVSLRERYFGDLQPAKLPHVQRKYAQACRVCALLLPHLPCDPER